MKYIFILIGALSPILPAVASAPSDLNPLGPPGTGAPELYGRILRLLLGFSGIGALFFFIWGGIILLYSRGNPEQVKSGRDTLLWAVLGLVVCFSSYIVLRFLIQTIITPTTQ